MRIALLTLEGLVSAAPVRRFLAASPERIALVALSSPFRPQRGGAMGQASHLMRRSGPGLLPYLAANFVIPRLRGLLGAPRDADAEAIPIGRLCRRLGIPAHDVPDMNGEAFLDLLRSHSIDLLLTFHCDQILSARTLAAAPLGGINVHAGLLPDHRGPTPTIHALLDADPRFGFTIHRMTSRIDAGDILVRQPIALPATTSALAAAEALHQSAAAPLLQVLDQIERGVSAAAPAAEMAYRGFPSRAELVRLRRLGRKAATWADVGRAFSTPV